MNAWINVVYLVAAVLFIYGLKGLSHPRTAVRGNLMGAVGMLIAILATLVAQEIIGYTWIILGLIIGSAIGAALATRVQMTAMPQMVALLNGFGGLASLIVAGAALSEAVFLLSNPGHNNMQNVLAGASAEVLQFTVATGLSGLIGAVTFWGSLVAYGKLEGITAEGLRKRLGILSRPRVAGSMPDQETPETPAETPVEASVETPVETAEVISTSPNGSEVPEAPVVTPTTEPVVEPAVAPAKQSGNLMSQLAQINNTLTTNLQAKAVLGGVCLLLCLLLVLMPTAVPLYWLVVVLSSILGWYLVIPIGGADMPVVIALLNSYSGLAAAATGFVLDNSILIITGSLVGASGIILSAIMCKAMNRSLTNVLFGVWVPEGTSGGDEVYEGKVKASSPEEVAMMLDGARRVVIVPGYGMAVSQAQHAVRDLTNLLESRGTEVEFGIHPVAGRMPGHMNVLLAEADIPYDKVREMDDINPTFEQTDVAIVIGANDVTNPVARTDPSSPIAGMPILDVSKAKSVIVVKRSLSPGFAGIANPLFAADNTLMLFADAKRGMLDVVNAMKEN